MSAPTMSNGTKRTVLWILAAAAGGLALAGAGSWYWIGRPLYTPGDAHRHAEAHPLPAADGSWTVATGLRLHHFERGRRWKARSIDLATVKRAAGAGRG